MLSYAAFRAGHTFLFLHGGDFFMAMTETRVDYSLDSTFRSFLSPDLLTLGLHRPTTHQSVDL